jgi:sensor histidine kinase YesM
MINPLVKLAETANEVANGQFDTPLVQVESKDEIGVVTKAFNQMLLSIRKYIEQIKISMELESSMKEKALMMENHLKDARLKYLQAQINPHFLFNTLNAGAQLAMMEGADKTYLYIQNMADFFRYNVKNNNESVMLKEEIELVDSYVYILNVRFSGEIKFVKSIDERYVNLQIPSMILQPIVENSINYGIRNIDWEGIIELSVYREENHVCISVRDNGIGMSQEIIDKVMNSELKASDITKDSNGVGLDNVIGRLRLFYGCEDVIEITSVGKNMGTEVAIYIPLTEGEN